MRFLAQRAPYGYWELKGGVKQRAGVADRRPPASSGGRRRHGRPSEEDGGAEGAPEAQCVTHGGINRDKSARLRISDIRYW